MKKQESYHLRKRKKGKNQTTAWYLDNLVIHGTCRHPPQIEPRWKGPTWQELKKRQEVNQTGTILARQGLTSGIERVPVFFLVVWS